MELSMEILSEDEGWSSLFCSAHCLQLCIKAGLSISAIDRLIGASQKLVSHFHHSVVASEALKKKQQQMNINGRKLVKSCTTRWNSTFEMLDRLIKLRWPVTAVLSDEEVTKRNDRYLDLKSEQWNLAEDLVKVLEPFNVVTTFLSYEENVSISSVFPLLHGLLDQLKPSTDSSAIRQFKDKVSQEIKRRWELDSVDVSSPLLISAALDPRFRNLTFTKIDDAEKEELKEKIIELAEEQQQLQKDDDKGNAELTEVIEPPPKKNKCALDMILGPEQTTSTTSTADELIQYLSETPSPRNHSPLLWWKANAERFTNLVCLARVLLAIPATSTPSERVFSTAGNTVTKLRNCLKPKNIDALIFLNKNLRKL